MSCRCRASFLLYNKHSMNSIETVGYIASIPSGARINGEFKHENRTARFGFPHKLAYRTEITGQVYETLRTEIHLTK